MSERFDDTETIAPETREQELFDRLATHLEQSVKNVPGLANWLKGVEPTAIRDRKALAGLPVLRKADLLEMQAADPPFGGFVDPRALAGNRVFMSPGPIFEPQGIGADPWNAARAFHAAGIRSGDKVHNAFAYHMTPGGFILDEGARALGCTVFPAGIGNTDMQIEAAASLKPDAYCGTPDFLKVMLDKAGETGNDLSSICLALVSGGALFPSLREEYRMRGINVFQCYATAECGVIAYETADADGMPNPGMVQNEDMIIEIVTPGTGDPVDEGEIGEVVVTTLNAAYPLVRLATGDLSAVLPGKSPCGRTNARIGGWMGRADQRTKIKGMFVDPRQIAEIVKRHPEIRKARLVVIRNGDRDAMTLRVEAHDADGDMIGRTMREITGLGGAVELVSPGALPNDGMVIADERDYSR